MSRAIAEPCAPDRSPARRIIAALLLAALTLLAGCSALRLAYSQASEFTYWWLDAYVDFDDAQSRQVRIGLKQWFAWQRRTQLPDYADLLARVQAELPRDTTADRVCALTDEIRARIDVAAARAVPIASGLVASVSAEQVGNVRKRFDKVNAEFREDYPADRRERMDKGLERAVTQFERLYGRIEPAQKQRLAQLLEASPFDPAVWLAERQARQQEALALLRRAGDGASAEALRAGVRAWMDHAQRSPREAYRRYEQQLVSYNCAAAATMHNLSTPTQRATAMDRLKGWEADLRALAADGA